MSLTIFTLTRFDDCTFLLVAWVGRSYIRYPTLPRTHHLVYKFEYLDATKAPILRAYIIAMTKIPVDLGCSLF